MVQLSERWHAHDGYTCGRDTSVSVVNEWAMPIYVICDCGCGCQADGEMHFVEGMNCHCVKRGCDCVVDTPNHAVLAFA